jgi:RHS repeat-associated protein
VSPSASVFQTKCQAERLSLISNVQNRADNGQPFPQNYQYDAAGNMTGDPTDLVTATYDAENRIATATKNGATATYTYDDDGNRVEKSNGASPPSGTLYWYMTPGIVGESDLAGNLKTEYVFFDGERVARRDFPSGNVSYYFSDHLKTASVVTDASGTILDESDYYPWGGELQFVNNLDNHYKFTGKERDSESGLDNFGARYNGSSLGRFTSPDPSMGSVRLENPQTWNRYTYVLNNPLRFVDPTGEEWNVAGSNGGSPSLEWTDTCGVADDCIKTAAVSNQSGITVYGTQGADDVTNYNANSKGFVNLADVAGNSGANFAFQPGVTATFASPQTAAGLFNAAAAYGQEYPDDSKLSLNDVGNASGTPLPPHQTHDLGRSIDMRYMDGDGNSVNNVMKADDDRMLDLISDFKQNGFNQIYSDNDQDYGVQWAPGHGNHIHMGKNSATAQAEHRQTTPPKQPGPH